MFFSNLVNDIRRKKGNTKDLGYFLDLGSEEARNRLSKDALLELRVVSHVVTQFYPRD